MKQTRLIHVKNQMSHFETLIPYFESSLYADKRLYKSHDDPKHLSRVTALEITRNGFSKSFLPLSRQVRGAITLEVRNASPWFSYFWSACNELSKYEVRFLE